MTIIFHYSITGQKVLKNEAMPNFEKTPSMIRFFEKYLDTNILVQKNIHKLQSTILNLAEWKTQTMILTRDILHDKISAA